MSFGLTLRIFYAWLLLLSLLAGPEPIHGLVKIPLGRVDNWPRWAKLLLPLVVTAMAAGRRAALAMDTYLKGLGAV